MHRAIAAMVSSAQSGSTGRVGGRAPGVPRRPTPGLSCTTLELDKVRFMGIGALLEQNPGRYGSDEQGLVRSKTAHPRFLTCPPLSTKKGSGSRASTFSRYPC